MARNRIIYQSQALFISPSSTGFHMQTGIKANVNIRSHDAFSNLNWTGTTGIVIPDGENDPAKYFGNTNFPVINRSLLEPLKRVQSCNFNFTINRQDVNEFGKLSRIDSIVMESPTVGLDFNYYVTDGGNERKMGFNLPSNFLGYQTSGIGRPNTDAVAYTGDGCISGFSALSGLIGDTQGNNYFIVTSKEGTDVQGDTVSSNASDFDVIAIGNGFISDYTLEASVGAIPTASVTVEAFNIRVDDKISGALDHGSAGDNNVTGNQVPGINDTDGQQVDINYNFDGGKLSTTGYYTFQGETPDGSVEKDSITALRPGDLLLEFLDSDGTAFTQSDYDGFADLDGDGKCHIQSFTVSVPMSRTVLGRLGNTFGYARLIDLPLNIDVSVSAIVSEIRAKNLFERLDKANKNNFKLTLRRAGETGEPGDTALIVDVKGARLEGESYSNAIGDNQTVDITFSTQVGGANDTSNGLFMQGTYAPWSTIPYWPLGKNKLDLKYSQGTPPNPI